MLTIYTICFNESLMLPFFVAWYRARFPFCRIVVYDNGSTDGSQALATSLGCEVRTFDTGGQLSDTAYLEIKNNCWKDSLTDWVMVVDMDELCDIDEPHLRGIAAKVVSIVPFHAYNMVNLADNTDLAGMQHGIREPRYDKYYLFDRRYISGINYDAGCHTASPRGYVDFGTEPFTCFHYKYIHPEYTIDRYAQYKARMSDHNKRKGYGSQYWASPDQIRAEYEVVRTTADNLVLLLTQKQYKSFTDGLPQNKIAS